VYNTEFTKQPICTASTLYQRKKIQQLKDANLPENEFEMAYEKVIAKACLCEDLAAGALIDHNQVNKRPLASAVCPGPNIAYFSKMMTLPEFFGHIYGRVDMLNAPDRPNMFISELKLYIEYLIREIGEAKAPTQKQVAYFSEYKQNLEGAISFYKALIPKMTLETSAYQAKMSEDLDLLAQKIHAISVA
jgi:hypothetical protein